MTGAVTSREERLHGAVADWRGVVARTGTDTLRWEVAADLVTALAARFPRSQPHQVAG